MVGQPYEKPIQLHEWVLLKYAKQGQTIIDTHFGSGSIALAVDKVNNLDKMNQHLTALEIDPYYYQKSINRLPASARVSRVLILLFKSFSFCVE
ncbi:MAG: hypothetical protein LAT68_06065 [Cyclobacteriaceae bacterium]|nr:site-specific DNA-methyltransferase [Cyclobacteriaceae bacterium]MCH8515876.1 hypothetical protein [Cyclobacteriaceae bacterium]